MRIGILGGSFNPIHNGHIMMGKTAREKLALDEVILVPAKHPPHKKDAELAPAEDRLKMAELVAGECDGFAVSDVELRRKEVSYTIHTIKELNRQYGGAEMFFLIGADTIKELPTWKDIDELTDLCQFVTIARKGAAKDDLDCLSGVFNPEKIARMRAFFLEVEPVPVSATEIRRKIARGESIAGLVPEGVERYIAERRLYKS
jgi:nicotinate-nucleotide adenylyltransferase